jgi:hypothetical protein
MKNKGLSKKQFEILSDLKWSDWSEHSSDAKSLIDELFLCFFKSTDSDDLPSERRKDIAFIIWLLKKTIDDLHNLDKAGDIPENENTEDHRTKPGECIECIKKQAEIDLLQEQLTAAEKRVNELIVQNWQLREEAGDPREDAVVKTLQV